MDAKPENDALRAPSRLAGLVRSGLLDMPPEPKLDRITTLVRRSLAADVALLSLVAETRQFFASQCGLPEPYATTRETPLSHSFCQHVVTLGQPLVVNDARLDPLVVHNLAVSDLGVIAYLGVPVRDRDGHVLGSLCAIGGAPRAWSDDDIALLSELARVAEDLMDLHRHALRASEAAEENGILAREYHHRVKNVLAVSAALVKLAAKDSSSATDLAQRSVLRLTALAEAHGTVGVGADAVPLGDLVHRLMAPYQTARLDAGGPAIEVTHEQVTPICLVLHELATNSMKYGALAQDVPVGVTWQVADGGVVLNWRERTAVRSAGIEGFGSQLIAIAARQLGGTTETAWDGGDLVVTLRFPARTGRIRN